jgi:hypothetical protein
MNRWYKYYVVDKLKVTPYHSKPAHLCALPRTHKPDVLLITIVSSIDSPCYALAKLLRMTANTASFVKDSEHYKINKVYKPSKRRLPCQSIRQLTSGRGLTSHMK